MFAAFICRPIVDSATTVAALFFQCFAKERRSAKLSEVARVVNALTCVLGWQSLPLVGRLYLGFTMSYFLSTLMNLHSGLSKNWSLKSLIID
jgi:hypothetical protein